MRQLKTPVAKESKKMKAERIKSFQEGQSQVLTVAVPVIIVVVCVIVFFVVVKTGKKVV